MREPLVMARVSLAVIRRAWPLLAWLACSSWGASLGCTASLAEDELVVPEAPDAPRMEPGQPDQPPAPVAATPEPAAPTGPVCEWEQVEPHRFAALVPPPESAECRPAPSRKRKAELGRVLRKQWKWAWPEHRKLAVEHGCDRLGELSSVVFEGSSGHGGSLELVRLDRRDEGGWDVTWIDYSHYFGRRAQVEGDPWHNEGPGPSTLRRGVLPAERVDPMLQRVRELLAVQAHELEPPPPPPGTLRGMSGYGSSRSFHVGLRLVDAGGHGVERYFVGYEGGGDEQALQLVLDLASAEVWKVLDDDALVAGLREVGPDDAAIRELLAGAFWAAREREPALGQWYIRERLLGLATTLGGPELVPALLDAVRPEAGSGSSEERSRASAINGIAAIVGFDVRYDADGKPRPVKTVTAEVLAACDRR